MWLVVKNLHNFEKSQIHTEQAFSKIYIYIFVSTNNHIILNLVASSNIARYIIYITELVVLMISTFLCTAPRLDESIIKIVIEQTFY